MLQSVRLHRFKSFIDQSVELAPLTLLVGANGSGKSNLLDALRFLNGIGVGMSLSDILRGRWESGQQVWPGVRGGVADAATRGEHSFELETVWKLPSDANRESERVQYSVGCALAPQVVLESERLGSISGHYDLFDTHADVLGGNAGRDAGDIRVALRHVSQSLSVEQRHSANRSLLAQLTSRPPVDPAVGRGCEQIRAALRRFGFVDIAPARMRGYVSRQTDVLGMHGENLSALTWQLCQDHEQKQDLLDWITELCAPELSDIDFVETELGDVMLVFVERDGRRIPARSLSDGSLRFLGQLMALRSAAEGAILLIEEIENGLHPTRAHLLVEALERATEHRGIQVIATTHSPLVLQALTPKALSEAVVMARIPEHAGTIARRLGTLPHFEQVSQRSSIEHLFATGWLERAL